ncbi:MAG TPA: DUF4142 domain-containing protein [Chitinophagaceae bacterium]
MSSKPRKHIRISKDWAVVTLHTLFACLFFSCSQETTYEDALQSNKTEIEEVERLDDAKFLVAEKSLNILQRQLMQLASTSGYSSVVVDFGKASAKLFDDMGNDIDRLAKDENIDVPTQMASEHQALLSQIENSSRGQFDRQLIFTLKEISAGQERQYALKASEASDPDIRAFAARKIGLIRTVDQAIRDVEKRLLPVESQ